MLNLAIFRKVVINYASITFSIVSSSNLNYYEQIISNECSLIASAANQIPTDANT